jgi:hypothetical protein
MDVRKKMHSGSRCWCVQRLADLPKTLPKGHQARCPRQRHGAEQAEVGIPLAAFSTLRQYAGSGRLSPGAGTEVESQAHKTASIELARTYVTGTTGLTQVEATPSRTEFEQAT